MNALHLGALLAYTFGALAYGALLVMWVRELGRMGWGARSNRQLDLLNGAIMIVSFVWFCGLIVQILGRLGGGPPSWRLEIGLLVLAYAFPPLIMHLTWAEVGLRRRLARRWQLGWLAAYAAAAAIPAYAFGIFLTQEAAGAETRLAWRLLGWGLPSLFIVTAVYCIAIVRGAPRTAAPRDRRQSMAMGVLFGVMLLIFILVLAVTQLYRGTSPSGYPVMASLLEPLAKSLPLIFVFVSTYFESRFYFFDLFIKRGFSLLLAVATLALWFTVALPFVSPYAAHPIGPWLFALAALPIVALAPLVYTRVSRFLDRRLLGRPYSTVEAVTRFLAALRAGVSEADTVARAEREFSEIFRAPAAVLPDDGTAPPFPLAHEAPVRCTAGASMRLLLGPRAGDAPYFSQDVVLVGSLADVFASVLDNLRLQARRHAEEQRAQELSLIASRSELKALRAQINPHFLFNALNAIAGLLHRDPATADRTIEKLADVFRYTLRGSESEWATLEDELEFVRAYLDVEEARFGERLHTSIVADPAARQARVPTMVVHTLVENAVKHGAAAVRGPAIVEVRAEVQDSRLVIAVRDNGPGFAAARTNRDPKQGGGYGLLNVRERLAGHFGAEASLESGRDEAAGHTVVTISLPLLTAASPRLAGAAR